MYNYTMTFKYDGEYTLPNELRARAREVPKMVAEKLESREFEMVDFNLSENYDPDNAERYIANAQINRLVVEIRLDLTAADLKSRDTIYSRCLKAMKQGKLKLEAAIENENEELGSLQSIIVFDVKRRASLKT
ncbi:hypothetical protein [Flavobacterium rivuli]|nr:hypothetical protein [Flavobacterium rivuli]